MKKIALVFLLLQILVLSLAAAENAPECTLCVGAATPIAVTPAKTIPLVVDVSYGDLATMGATIDALSPEQRRNTTLLVQYAVSGDKDRLLDIEQKTQAIVDWARSRGPFDGIGIQLEGGDDVVAAYAVKRLAVTAQGQDVTTRIVLPPTPTERLNALFENGAQSYFDALIVPAGEVTATAAWLAERDPSKKIFAVVDAQSPNVFYDLARALADGATRAYLRGTADESATLSALNQSLAGDYAFDSTSRTEVLDAKGNKVAIPVLTFVRGKDLMTLVVPRGDAAASTIVALPGDNFERPQIYDVAGQRDIKDAAKQRGRFLVGLTPAKRPFAVLVSRTEKPNRNVTREAIDVATQRGITVEEIIRNHQAYDSFQESIEPRYIARNKTSLRFDVGGGADAVEATIAGDYFSDPKGRSDWVWQEFYVNGVKWKYGRIPELPLIQPEKVAQLPLDIHLTNEYRYQLVRETDVLGYRTYEVRFEPPPNAPAGLPLYRGTVWIDSKSWARIRIDTVQLNLTGEVLSNEERVEFQPFDRETNAPLTAPDVLARDPRTVLWLPRQVSAQQVVSAAGRANVILRSTDFSNYSINTADYDRRLSEAFASESRMVRDTENGMRYLEKKGDGQRVVKEGFDSSRLFMVGGIHHDPGLEFPVVPLGGIDYFNFNLLNRGIQANVFFAGVIAVANATHPNVANTRTNVGVDFFGIAIPVQNTIFRGGEEVNSEDIKILPTSLTLRAGHPIFDFGKIDLSLGVAHFSYKRGDDTSSSFEVPANTFLLSPEIDGSYARRGYKLTASYSYNTRTSWEPWGNLAEYSDDQKTFTRYAASFGKSFYLPKFQRLGIDFNYLGGQRLDRFSKYELGFIGTQRVHGIRSGSVRAEKALLGHLSYGFVISDQLRMEVLYDHAVVDDETAGYRREPFQGLGIAGQTVGPFGTLLRLDIGKSIGRNAQDGFVANVVFLKLF